MGIILKCIILGATKAICGEHMPLDLICGFANVQVSYKNGKTFINFWETTGKKTRQVLLVTS
jgi:hypothetical protein